MIVFGTSTFSVAPGHPLLALAFVNSNSSIGMAHNFLTGKAPSFVLGCCGRFLPRSVGGKIMGVFDYLVNQQNPVMAVRLFNYFISSQFRAHEFFLLLSPFPSPSELLRYASPGWLCCILLLWRSLPSQPLCHLHSHVRLPLPLFLWSLISPPSSGSSAMSLSGPQ